MQQTRMVGPQFMEPAIMVDWDVYNFLISGEPVSMKLIIQGIPQVCIYIIIIKFYQLHMAQVSLWF